MVRTQFACKVVATLLVAALVSQSLASAQERNRGRGRGFGGGRGAFGAPSGLGLLGREEVRKDLKLTDEQAKQVRELAEAARPNFGNFRDATDEERREMFAEMNKKRTEAELKLKTVLKPEQQTRLDQIVLQQRGFRALQDEKVVAKLELDADQKKKLESVFAAGDDERQQLFSDIREGVVERDQIRSKMETLEKDLETNVMAALNDDQKKAFTALQGEKLDLPRGRGFGRGGRRGGEGRPQSDN